MQPRFSQPYSSDTSNQLEHGQPNSSLTPIKDTDESLHSMDSGIHTSNGEACSVNELMSLYAPISSSSPLVILDPETVLHELHKDINSLFQNRKKHNSSGDHGIPNIQSTLEEVSMNQCLATSLIWG